MESGFLGDLTKERDGAPPRLTMGEFTLMERGTLDSVPPSVGEGRDLGQGVK